MNRLVKERHFTVHQTAFGRFNIKKKKYIVYCIFSFCYKFASHYPIQHDFNIIGTIRQRNNSL